MDLSLDLITARYHEDLAWTHKVPAPIKLVIYNKGDDLNREAYRAQRNSCNELHRLPNVGREAHTYLHHIVESYDSLADVLIFCQGKPFDHAYDFHQTLRKLSSEELKVGGFHWLGHIVDTDDLRGRRLYQIWSKNPERKELSLDEFHEALFNSPSPEFYTFYCGGQFAITRGAILRRPLSFYQKALKLSAEFPEAAHCYERSWDKVFDVTGVDPKILDKKGAAYLKPIRRLMSGGSLPDAPEKHSES